MNETIEREATILANVLEFSEQRDKISAALVKASGLMGDVVKNATNPAFRSKYADLSAVIEAVQPALQKSGIAVLQPPAAAYGDAGCTVTVETMLLHESGQFVRSQLSLRPTKIDPQGVGSAITYGRRYSLQGMCGIAPEDDDGNSASGNASANGNARVKTRDQRREEPKRETNTKERLLSLLRNETITPSEKDLAIESVTGDPDPKSILTPDLAEMVIANLEKLIADRANEVPL